MAVSWFKRRGRKLPRKLPQRHLAPVEEIVEQGLLVADVAVRMSVKNAIIMNALQRRADYDEEQIVEMVREAVAELAREREQDATHIERMRSEIRKTGRSAWSDSEYGDGDNRTLRHRQQVYAGVAAELRQRAADAAYLSATAERARTAAWHEIGDSLKERATHPYYSGGASEEYQAAREERIELLISRDLTELIRQRAEAGDGKKRRFGRKSDASEAPRRG